MDSNLALEVNRLHKRTGTVWGRRYQAILVSEEETAQVAASDISWLTASRKAWWLMPASGPAFIA